MKIAVTVTGPHSDDHVESRFGRCAYFLIVDTETKESEALENPNIALDGGAGIQSAQMMAERGVQVVLTGNCGPKAFQVFDAAGIQVVTGVSGSVRQAIEQFGAGAFPGASGPNVASHYGAGSVEPLTRPVSPQIRGGRGGGMGMGRGRCMGGGRGLGRGMGGGRGMGQGMGTDANFFPPEFGTPQHVSNQIPAGDEIETLKAQARAMEDQLRAIHARIRAIEPGHGAYALVAAVDPDKCIACGACEEICPANAISVEKIAKIDRARCTGCGQCVAECPADALFLRKIQPRAENIFAKQKG